VQTHPNHFLVAMANGTVTWTVNADHVRRWVMAYDHQRHRLMIDAKTTRDARHDGIQARVEQLAMRHHARLITWSHTVSRQLLNHVMQRGHTSLVYDDTERGYVRSFPWDALRLHVQEKAERLGVAFTATRDQRQDGHCAPNIPVLSEEMKTG
jgi:hypothetical protein